MSMQGDGDLGPVLQFEGEYVRKMDGKLPAITMEMPGGYTRGMHLQMAVEVRVRNVGHVEDKDGELTRVHTFALEEVQLLRAFNPANRPAEAGLSVGGNASGQAWKQKLIEFCSGEVDELEIEDDEDLPQNLREMLGKLEELRDLKEFQQFLGSTTPVPATTPAPDPATVP